MYIKRNLESNILRCLPTPEIIAITGPRQSGKTTMIAKLMEGLTGAVSISFDDRSALALFERATDDFIVAYVKGRQYLFIDEFQYATQGGKILKYIFDHHKIKIIISGSSALDLTIRAVKYLVGRILIFQLYPFDFEEFLRAKDDRALQLYVTHKQKIQDTQDASIRVSSEIHQLLSRYWEEYLRFGGYPRIVLEESLDIKKELLRNIVNTYFLREVRDVLGLIDDYKLQTLIKGLTLQIGNLIEYQELSRLSGYSHTALKKYLHFLEETYVVRFVKPFFKNRRTEIVKNPKVYFVDTGLRNSVADDFRPLGQRGDAGAVLENGLAVQLLKHGKAFNFWRDKKKNELDFVVREEDGKLAAFEVKQYLKSLTSPSLNAFARMYPEIKVTFLYGGCSPPLLGQSRVLPVYLGERE